MELVTEVSNRRTLARGDERSPDRFLHRRAGYLAFQSSSFGGNVVRIDCGKYMSGAVDRLVRGAGFLL